MIFFNVSLPVDAVVDFIEGVAYCNGLGCSGNPSVDGHCRWGNIKLKKDGNRYVARPACQIAAQKEKG